MLFSPLWHVTAVMLVILAPSHLRYGLVFWRLPPEQLSQGLAMGAAYLALALFLQLQSAHRVRFVTTMAAGLVCFGSSYLFLFTRPDTHSSRIVILVSAALGTLLAFFPFRLHRRYRPLGLLALVVTTGAFVAIGVSLSNAKISAPGPQDHVIPTALNAVSVAYLRNLLDPVESDGGAVTRYGDGFMLVTGSGEIYRLEWESGGNSLRSTRLPLSAPMDRKAFQADQPPGAPPLRLRVTDITLDNSDVPTRIYLAHQHWNREGKCFTMRVSVAPVPDRDPNQQTPATGWRTVFEAQPCLVSSEAFDDIESGGRLAWARNGELLLTLGDFGFTGLLGPPVLAQAEKNDYGKVLLLDLAGGHEVFTMGHRNPQGLFIDRKGRIWETEHGPQGGDELNLLRRGKNYGWPFVTHGTQYGHTYWPISRPNKDKLYEEPVHAFTPAIAISNLIELGPEMFSEWEGDLLVASLRLQSLYRVRLYGDRVAYVEPIKIGRRIRDLEQGKDGRIVLWTDEHDVVVLARTTKEPEGERLYGQCSLCHEPVEGGSARGPSLRRVVGKPVASDPGYVYSPALASLGGSWTEKRLDEFLRNPAAYAPGTSMEFKGFADAVERQALIEYLKNYR